MAERLDSEDGPPLKLSARTRLLIEDMRLEWRELDRRIAALTAEFVTQARNDEAACRLTTIPGFGALNATALVAAIGTGQTFQSSRDLAAWLGLTPRQATTGGKPRLLSITKRGNTYLRTLLIHGARAGLPSLSASSTAMGEWLRDLIGRAHKKRSSWRSPASWRGSHGRSFAQARAMRQRLFRRCRGDVRTTRDLVA